MPAAMADIGLDVMYARADDIIDRLGTCALDELERARAAHIGNEVRRKHFIAGRVLLRYRLSVAVGHAVQPAAWRFTHGEYGKPCVAPGLPQINFSISHATGMIAIAASSTIEVGIDLELITGTQDTDPVADQLSPREQAWLERQNETDRWASFLQLWTAKEAVSKLVGTGCGLDFGAIEVDVAAGLARCRDALIADGNQMSIDMETVEAEDASYCLSVASMQPTGPGSVYSMELFMPPSMETPAFL